MKQFTVTGTFVSIGSGTLRLSPEQAAARSHNLTSLGKNLYKVNAPVGFKRGEVFGFDGDLNKSLAAEIAEFAKATSRAADRAPSPARTGLSSLLGGKKATAVVEPEEQEADAPAKQEETAA